MSLTYTFGNLTDVQTGWLDTNFNEAGLLGTLPCAVSGTNALTLTPLSVPQPAIAALQALVRVSGIAVATNSGATTANVAGLGVLNVYKDTPSGPAALAGGEIVLDNLFILIYDAALNGGMGGWHLETAPSSAAGTVTSVATGAGLTGGPVTNAGTIALGTISSLDLMANATGGTAAPSGNTLSAYLDAALGTPGQGSIIARGASLWGGVTEASWVPLLSFGGGSVGVTYTTHTGSYMQIGYLTIATFNIVLSSKGSSTGDAAVSLPVSAAGASIGGGLLTNYGLGSSVTTLPFLYIAAAGSVASIFVEGTGTVTNLLNSDFGNTSAIAGILCYFTG